MRFEHTNRNGYWIGFADFCTAGLYLLFAMPRGLQAELDAVLGRKTRPYVLAYLLGIPTLFVYTLIWMARIAGELGAKAAALGIAGPYTSYRHMVLWNTLGLLFGGPMIATGRFFDTLNRIERELNKRGTGPAGETAPI